MAAKGGQRKGPPPRRRALGRQRLWLVAFAAVFAAIFIIFAVAQGIGAPSVPSGDAALVQGRPGDEGRISEAEVKQATARQIAAAASESKEKAPKPGSKKYKEKQEAALGELLDQIWLTGQAEELNLSVTNKQIAESLEEIKEQQFPTEKAFQEFLKKSHFTQEELNDRVEQQVLIEEIEAKVKGEAPPASASEIEAYYEEKKATEFTTPRSRDVHLMFDENKKKIEEAHKELEGDQSAKNWKRVVTKYFPTAAKTGGLQKGLSEESVPPGPVTKAVFDAPTGQLSDVLKFEEIYVVVEPVSATIPPKAKSLAEVRSQISQTLDQQSQEKAFAEFAASYAVKWGGRTLCAHDFLFERCTNFRGSGHPENAPAACYEANPKVPAKECPAPVLMTKPTLPGTVTELVPQGKPFVQRPTPGPSAGKSAKSTELPEGAAPPEAAPEETGE